LAVMSVTGSQVSPVGRIGSWLNMIGKMVGGGFLDVKAHMLKSVELLCTARVFVKTLVPFCKTRG
jgi:hypothetical protein